MTMNCFSVNAPIDQLHKAYVKIYDKQQGANDLFLLIWSVIFNNLQVICLISSNNPNNIICVKLIPKCDMHYFP